MILETIVVGPMQANCYILASDKNSDCLIIDPGADERKIRNVLEKYNLIVRFVINTHGHFDHIGCDDKFGVAVYAHKQDVMMLKKAELNFSGLFSMPYRVTSQILPLEDKDEVKTEDLELEVIHVPGHTPGGIALLIKKPKSRVVFTGDSLFCQGIGRTDFEGADEGLLLKSIKEKILTLPDDTVIYPGHGASSTIGEEKRNNPFLR
jgi:glyoxylase-like metal-dependent hydrolase (beta-lactamase superfamily II)